MEIKKLQSFDGYPITYRVWETPDPKGVIIYLHGVQSHGEWFLGSCQFLADHGYAVYAPDRRGSGVNILNRGDCPTYRALVRDVRCFIDLAGRSTAPGTPVHLVGVSWGGKLAVATAILHPGSVRSVVLVAPGLSQKVDLPFIEKLKVLLCRVFCPTARFSIPIERPEMFTSNPDRIRYLYGDKLMLKQATARFMAESVRMGFCVRRRAGDMTVPVMMMLAEIDEIVDNNALITLFQRFPAQKKIVKLYQGAYHTLEFEKDTSGFFRDMLHWLETV